MRYPFRSILPIISYVNATRLFTKPSLEIDDRFVSKSPNSLVEECDNGPAIRLKNTEALLGT